MKALTYGQKLIAEAIEAHFGERVEDHDEDADDTSNRDAWEAFDAVLNNPEAPAAPIAKAHDWQKTKNDLVMWVCEDCKMALPGGLTKPHPFTHPICEAAPVAPTSAGDGEIVKARVLDDKDLHGWDHQRHDFMREHAETFTNELGREIRIVGWRSVSDPLAIRYILEGPRSHTYQTMTPMEAERLIKHLQAALASASKG
ncbi:hypothetical protein NKH72_21715 [Mesorhizobium sp. M0955]|uniref:hypothetical protein n=1 Tax=Mesorhizobium sp. M0955 TaxID=2957033 RepID=UPI00333AC09A